VVKIGILHTSFASGNMFTAGSDYGDTGTSGLNEFANRINVESGILGTVSGAYYATSGAYYTTSGATTVISGAYYTTSGAMLSHTHNGTNSAVLGRPTLYKQGATFSFGEPAGEDYTIASGTITTLGGGSLFISAHTSLYYSWGKNTSNIKLLLDDVEINTSTPCIKNNYTNNTTDYLGTMWLGSVGAGAKVIKLYFTQTTSDNASGALYVPTISSYELI